VSVLVARLGRAVFALVVLAGLLLVGGSVAGASVPGSGKAARPATVHRGGSMTVVIDTGQWPNLDPVKDNESGINGSEGILYAIYGGLFEFGPHGKVIPDEATGYKFSNGGKTVDIQLRPGVVFSDGTPLTAEDVAQSINRDLLPANACACDTDFTAVKSVTASGPSTVVLQLSEPFAPIIGAFQDTPPDFTIDPTAFAKEGATNYGQDPVGAGPFKVVHNLASSTLQLERNPLYWEKGYPLLDKLTFTSVGTDQSAYSSIETGQAQLAEYIGTTQMVQTAKANKAVKVIDLPAQDYEFVSLNEKVAPFNNILAREAIYYATDVSAITSHLYDGLYPSDQSPTAPAESISVPTIPGYRTYDLAKAKALVKQLGGLSVDLSTTANNAAWTTEAEVLASQWEKAGIKVSITINTLEQTIESLSRGSWQALDSNWGASDPALALPAYFSSSGAFSGIHDPVLDNLINEGATTSGTAARTKIYKEIGERMSQEAEAPFLYAKTFFDIASSSVQGIPAGQWDIYWEKVWLSS
jgi:peptide/nickel transport system substrate-binding protein